MKIKKIDNKNFKLIKLHLIKLNVYKKSIKKKNSKDSSNYVIEQIELHLKNVLKIIYEYHVNNKLIFFIGLPPNYNKNINEIFKNTKHLQIPESIWINGLLSNKLSITTYLKKRHLKNVYKQKYYNIKNIKLLLSVDSKPDLIVIFNSKTDLKVLEEFYRLGVPIITFSTNIYNDIKSTYKVPGNFNFILKNIENIFLLMLYAIFKKF